MTGQKTSVLEAQAMNGFAFVSEKTCEDLLAAKGKAVPDGDDDGLHRKTELALACIAAVKPDLTDVEASTLINKAFVEEHPDTYQELRIDPEALGDVLTANEAKKVAEYEVQVAHVKAMQKLVLETRDKKVHKYFHKAPVIKYSAAQKKQPRWLPGKDAKNTRKITDWILQHSPPSVSVVCDDLNGRWRVISENLDVRSISWTKRGYEKAALEVIHQAWEYHKDFRGLAAPFDVDELKKRFQEIKVG